MNYEELQRVTLERFKYQVNSRFDINGPINTSADIEWNHLDRMTGSMVMRLKAHVIGQTLEKQTITYPKDWWQAVKERWFPGWAKGRWPVEYKMITMEARVLYPRISLPKEQHHLHILTTALKTKYQG